MISNLHIKNGLKNWPLISDFTLKHKLDTDFFNKHDSIVFYTHPFKILNVTRNKNWSAKIKKLLSKIRNNFKGNLYFLTPFKENRISKYILLSELIEYCKSENIKYLSLRKKDYFSRILSKKQGRILDQFLTNFNFNSSILPLTNQLKQLELV